ncbi:Crp/Fnr family transcriptional regulator [Oxalobacteraceae bacterium R-40]|uniref:Crp/Fnr family transcriptional regulator n=1 Tax=Keguizhuia sedimenti TaxID=3064264 RepID=A0ABU1BQD0_9BURK|nr:Crp/Fnr family transcriptional regulator [Oxalobacteraceae bacterium R-40]
MPANQKIKVASFLAQLPLFNELEETELAQIAEHTTELHVAKGDRIFERGDPCTGFHTVVYGRVKLFFTSSQGNEKVVEIIGPGHSFGEALMFMNKPYIVTAQAVADTMLLHVAKDAIMNEIERHPGFACKMLAGLSRRLHGLICDVEAYSLNSGTQRVIGYLLKEIQQDGEKVDLPTSKTVVASRLNLTPEHFSRILHDLAEQSFIEVNGREITIVSVEKLRTYDK